jgi:hypothetical protein
MSNSARNYFILDRSTLGLFTFLEITDRIYIFIMEIVLKSI